MAQRYEGKTVGLFSKRHRNVAVGECPARNRHCANEGPFAQAASLKGERSDWGGPACSEQLDPTRHGAATSGMICPISMA
jgi:hypothetical protein